MRRRWSLVYASAWSLRRPFRWTFHSSASGLNPTPYDSRKDDNRTLGVLPSFQTLGPRPVRCFVLFPPRVVYHVALFVMWRGGLYKCEYFLISSLRCSLNCSLLLFGGCKWLQLERFENGGLWGGRKFSDHWGKKPVSRTRCIVQALDPRVEAGVKQRVTPTLLSAQRGSTFDNQLLLSTWSKAKYTWSPQGLRNSHLKPNVWRCRHFSAVT